MKLAIIYDNEAHKHIYIYIYVCMDGWMDDYTTKCFIYTRLCIPAVPREPSSRCASATTHQSPCIATHTYTYTYAYINHIINR